MMDIRKAQLSDKRDLFCLISQFPTPTPPDEPTYNAMFEELFEDSNSFVAVAELDEKLIGYISGYRHTAFYLSGKAAWVDELLVSEKNRGSGAGRQLMNCFETWAADSGCRMVSLATAGAKNFYEHIGYSSKAGYYKRYLVNDT